jgi:membrane protein YqaA with SNARE-associated domain
MWQRQTNPELERLRHNMLRSYGLAALWTIGFPLFIGVTIVLLGMSGLLHYR